MKFYLNQKNLMLKSVIKITLSLFVLSSITPEMKAQSFVFGPKLGPSLEFQIWNGIQRQTLIAYHGSFFIESYDEDEPSSLYAEVGFHKRGSSERQRFINNAGNDFIGGRQRFEFNNVNLITGAKRILNMDKKAKPYYLLAIRLEYTLSTNLEQYERFAGYFPVDPFVNKINYGFTVGGGFQYDFSELIGGAIEIRLNPDISKQYDQPPLENVINPWDFGNRRTLAQQSIRNLSFEVSAVLRLKRIVEFVN